MNTVKKMLRNLSVIAITFVFLMFLIAPEAKALITSMSKVQGTINEMVEIKDGKFEVSVNDPVPGDLRIGSAVVSLPKGETGTIEYIVITGPDGQREFGCGSTSKPSDPNTFIKVTDGTDLIKSCGGPAYLKAGETTYMAKGSNFKPQKDVEFGIALSE